jgi:acyl-CoA thioester hydrolase
MRVYYDDTDWGGVVYYANYLHYAEYGRTEFLRERGISLTEYHKTGIMFVVVEVHCKYRAPARYDDMLDIETTLADSTALTLTFETRMYNQQRKHLVTCRVKLACISAEGKVEHVPEDMRAKFGA